MEVEDEMKKGLCFVCDEPFTLDHAAKHKNISFVVVEMDEENDRDFSEKFQPEAFSKDNKEYSTHNLQIDFQEDSF